MTSESRSTSRHGICLTVRDDGAGIAPGIWAHVFEPFVQATQSPSLGGGLGRGLALVKGLVDLHGGHVSIRSGGSQGGTAFSIWLPRAADEPDSVPSPASRPSPHRRVLLVEDDPDASDTLREALMLNGHTVLVVRDGPSALREAPSFRPDVVICDIGLPSMNGYAVSKAMRANIQLQNVLLIALTGYAQADDLLRATQAGFDKHLAKPACHDELESLLASTRRE